MKYSVFLFTFFAALTNVPAQDSDFAPLGAKWYYSEYNSVPPSIIPHIVECTAKEMFQGKWCSKLVSSSDDILPNPAYVYTENDTVYYFSPGSNQFEILYDFTAEVGDQWTIEGLPNVIPGNPLPYASDTITVDSISSMIVGGDTLKVWHIHNTFWFEWGGLIIEKIGNDKLFIPKMGLIEAYVWGLRCFESPGEAYHLVPYPCDTIYSTISKTLDPNESDGLKVAPNPFQEEITIISGSPFMVYSFSLYDQTGRRVFLQPNAVGSLVVNTEPLPPGLYYWNVVIGGVIVRSGKCVKT